MAAVFTYFKDVCRRLFRSRETKLVNTSKTKARQIASILAPFETYVVSIQRILIWEKPYVSAVALIFTNLIFFWITVVWKCQMFSLFTIFALITFIYWTWTSQIWPEIRVPPDENEDTEEWTTVNPQVLSVPEIGQYVEDLCTAAKKWNDALWSFRSTSPGLFCLASCMIFSVLAFVGHSVPGIIIVYIALSTVITGPGVMLHVIPRTKMRKFLAYLSGSCPPRSGQMESSDVDGSGLDEFLPETNKEMLAVLDIPMISLDVEKQNESDANSLELPSELGFPSSKDSLLTPSLTEGFSSFPDPTESSDDEFVPEVKSYNVQRGNASNDDPMQFVPTHFNGNDSLNFDGRVAPINPLISQIKGAIAANVINNVISSAVSGLTTLTTNKDVIDRSKVTKSNNERRKRHESDTSSSSSSNGFEIIDDVNPAPDSAQI